MKSNCETIDKSFAVICQKSTFSNYVGTHFGEEPKNKGKQIASLCGATGTIETWIYLDKWISIKGEIKHDSANTKPPPPI